MEEKSIFSFYTCRYNHYIGTPIIIVTCTTKPINTRYISEYFLFIPMTNYYYGLSMAAFEYKLLDLPINFDYMIQLAINGCQGKIDIYLSELYKANNDTSMPYHSELRADSPVSFMKLIREGKFKEQIALVRNNTKCIRLKNFIEQIIESEESFDITYKEIV